MTRRTVALAAALLALGLTGTLTSCAPTHLVVDENYAAYPDGWLSTTHDGRRYLSWPTDQAPQTPRVIDGRLTFQPNAAAGGGYASVALPGTVHLLGADVAFTPYTESGGLVALVAWKSDIGASFDTGHGVPEAPVHFTMSPTQWALGVYRKHGGELTLLKSGVFSKPLVADGKRVYRVELTVDTARGEATVHLPDGQTVTASDPEMRTTAKLASVEPFRLAGAPKATRPLILRWWAG